MLAKRYRVPASDIRRILKNGKRLRYPWFDILYEKSERAGLLYACIVSTSVDKRAVGRHMIKRVVSEAMRTLLPTLQTGVTVIVVVKSKEMENNQHLVTQRLTDVLRREGLVS